MAKGSYKGLHAALVAARAQLAVLREDAAPACGVEHYNALGALLEEYRTLEARILQEAERALVAKRAAQAR